MCIIAYSPQGIDIPHKKVLKTCFENNSDGAGIMIHLGNKIFFKKGFMDFESFYSYLQKLKKVFDLKKYDTAIHFRIATSGGINPYMCHPFLISRKEKDLKKLQGITDIGCVMHNGVINDFGNDQLSDTAEFTKLVVYPFRDKIEEGLELINKLKGTSKLLIFLKDKIIRLGNWIEHKGIFYSNTSFKKQKIYYSLKFSKKLRCECCNQFGKDISYSLRYDMMLCSDCKKILGG